MQERKFNYYSQAICRLSIILKMKKKQNDSIGDQKNNQIALWTIVIITDWKLT